jgi:response regulator RpfG family c-di-GMP phosphodiesterase
MADEFDHTVLIVDGEELTGKSLGRFLKSISINYVYKESGKSAIEEIQKASKPFSLVISDQRMPGMTGSEFLGKVKEVSPDTVRFILTGYSDMDAIIQAVNEGSIHKYLTKPWDNDDLVEKLESGFNQFELSMENDKLFKLAKEQNTKLYQLNMDLKKSSDAHQEAIAQQNNEIEKLTRRTGTGENRDYIKELAGILEKKDMVDESKLNFLYSAILDELIDKFHDISKLNGFEMPEEAVKQGL